MCDLTPTVDLYNIKSYTSLSKFLIVHVRCILIDKIIRLNFSHLVPALSHCLASDWPLEKHNLLSGQVAITAHKHRGLLG